MTGMQHAVTMHDEAGEAAEGRTLRCCRSTRAQTPPKKPVDQWWLPSILSRLAQAPFQWCNHFPETRSLKSHTLGQPPHLPAASHAGPHMRHCSIHRSNLDSKAPQEVPACSLPGYSHGRSLTCAAGEEQQPKVVEPRGNCSVSKGDPRVV